MTFYGVRAGNIAAVEPDYDFSSCMVPSLYTPSNEYLSSCMVPSVQPPYMCTSRPAWYPLCSHPICVPLVLHGTLCAATLYVYLSSCMVPSM